MIGRLKIPIEVLYHKFIPLTEKIFRRSAASRFKRAFTHGTSCFTSRCSGSQLRRALTEFLADHNCTEDTLMGGGDGIPVYVPNCSAAVESSLIPSSASSSQKTSGI